MYLATPSQMKAAEANAVAAGETYIGLMENAGAAAVQELCRYVDINADSRVLIICGRGNNGGDGFVMARLIADMGARRAIRRYYQPVFKNIKGQLYPCGRYPLGG